MQSTPSLVSTFSWALQFALGLGTALGAAALAFTFRRPAMRVLAATAAMVAVASGLIWLSLSARAFGFGDAAGPVLALTVFPISPWLLALLHYQLLALIAQRTDRAWPRWQVVSGVFGGAVGLGLALTVAGLARSPSLIGAVSSVGAILAYFSLAALGWRWQAREAGAPSAVRFLSLAFALLGVRSTLNVVVALGSISGGGPPEYGVGVTTSQLILFTLSYVLQLVAVLEDERNAIETNAERLRAAEASRAASARLESLGRMAGGIAHDFNNLLSVITLSAGNARTTVGAAAGEELQVVASAAQRGQELTRQLVAFARQAPAEVSRFDANDRLGRMAELLRRVTGREVRFAVTPAPAAVHVTMDPSQFDQVVMNLVANARDATAAGGSVSVELAELTATDAHRRSASATGAGGWLCVSVADTGCGIAADVLPHIFEPFYTTKQAGEGTGLGLATCEGIVRRAGGRIEVHSEVGRGARFEVLLPIASA